MFIFRYKFARYFVVGGMSAVIDWIIFFVLLKFGWHYVHAAIASFIVATLFNFYVARKLVFSGGKHSLLYEVLVVYSISMGGLVLNVFIMHFTMETFNISEMQSKVLATALVFLYSFVARKLAL